MKYLLCILSLAFLLVGVGLFSNEEDLQGFREETGKMSKAPVWNSPSEWISFDKISNYSEVQDNIDALLAGYDVILLNKMTSYKYIK